MLALVLACICVARVVAENHYVYFTDGRLEVYPHELVKELQTTADGYALTLINDSVISWTADEVERVSNEGPELPQLTEFEFDDKLVSVVTAIVIRVGDFTAKKRPLPSGR